MTQSHILFEVRRSDSPTMLQVARELGVDVTTFSRQVKALEAKVLIVRRSSPDDRRVTLLELTEEGERVLERIDSFMSERLEKVFDRMSGFERETVVRSLGLLNEALIRTARDAESEEGMIACCK